MNYSFSMGLQNTKSTNQNGKIYFIKIYNLSLLKIYKESTDISHKLGENLDTAFVKGPGSRV